MLRLVTDRFDPPAMDTAVSSAVLRRVATGEDPATLRLWVPTRSVAFGRQDRVRPGYPEAVSAAANAGFAPVERLAGGRAAVFHEGTIAFSWATPADRARDDITTRFRGVAHWVLDALGGLGVAARIGEVPGEYCPGEWSVNLGGTRKVMGVGQRLVRGAAHAGGVIVVHDAELVNRPLTPVYAALGYQWRPEATGAIGDVLPGVGIAEMAAALIAALPEPAEPGAFGPDLLRAAEALAPEHDPAR